MRQEPRRRPGPCTVAVAVVVSMLLSLVTGTRVAPAQTATVRDTVVLIGDSLAVEAQPYLERRLQSEGWQFRAHVWGGTAMCDWADEVLDTARDLAVHTVIVSFTGNAITSCMRPPGIAPSDAATVARYTADVTWAVDRLTAAGIRVVLQLQPPRDQDRIGHNATVDGLNALYRRLAAARARVVLADGRSPLVDAAGGYDDRLPCLPGEPCDADGTVEVRGDGLHFCPEPDGGPGCRVYSPGAVRFAAAMAEAVGSRWSTPVDATSAALAGPAPMNPGDALDCGRFAGWRAAQSWFERYQPWYGDTARLDGDGDGTACEQLPDAPVDTPTASTGEGYWLLSSNGTVYGFGSSRPISPRIVVPAGRTAVSVAAAGASGGYWVLDSAGVVYARGATHHGQLTPGQLADGERATVIAARPDGRGYWIFTSAGRAFTFGSATRAATRSGDLSGLPLNGAVVAAAVTRSGDGYWMVGEDGGVFAFDTGFHGSMGGRRLNAPVLGMIPDRDGGYWLVAGDGGVFAFDAPFRGSVPAAIGPGRRLNRPIVTGLANGDGYLLVAADGGVFNFSDRPFLGSLADQPPPAPVVGVAVRG